MQPRADPSPLLATHASSAAPSYAAGPSMQVATHIQPLPHAYTLKIHLLSYQSRTRFLPGALVKLQITDLP